MERFQTKELESALQTLKGSSSAEDEKARRVLKEKMAPWCMADGRP